MTPNCKIQIPTWLIYKSRSPTQRINKWLNWTNLRKSWTAVSMTCNKISIITRNWMMTITNKLRNKLLRLKTKWAPWSVISKHRLARSSNNSRKCKMRWTLKTPITITHSQPSKIQSRRIRIRPITLWNLFKPNLKNTQLIRSNTPMNK